MVWMAPVLKDNIAFLSCKEAKTGFYHHTIVVKPLGFTIRSRLFVKEAGTDLEHTVIVHVFQGEGKALRQHSVKPTLEDGRNAEPVQRELHKECQQGDDQEEVFFCSSVHC